MTDYLKRLWETNVRKRLNLLAAIRVGCREFTEEPA